MGSQFIHIEGYARVESAKATKKHGNIETIIGEAKRELEFSKHVSDPKKPMVLFGSLDNLKEVVYQYTENTHDALGRKLRKDALCLLAGVVSVPSDLTDEQWKSYRKETAIWLIKKYGKNLKCIVEHNDEVHKHIHFFAVPKAGQSFAEIHDGIKAKNEVKQRSKNDNEVKSHVETEGNKAYIEAMKCLQDDFYKKVSSRYGMTRLGPRRRRLTREQWKAEQIAALSMAKAKQLVETKKTEALDLLKQQRQNLGKAYDEIQYWKNLYLAEKTKNRRHFELRPN